MNEEKETFIGRENKQFFSIDSDTRNRHVYSIGLTGTGKTTFLENIAAQDIVSGEGVCVIDPHGDMSRNLIGIIPKKRINDVIYINLTDSENPISINPLENGGTGYLNSLIASSLISTFKNLWMNSWGPRLEYVLSNTILALLEYPKDPGVSLLGIPKMLTDSKYRRRILKYVEDPKVKDFWFNEFEKWDKRFVNEVISPILNKVGAYLSSPIIRNVVGQAKSSFDFKWAIQKKKIVIVNLSKGLIGEDKANLMGSIIVSMFWQSALEGAYFEEKDRQNFSLIIDEFQNFTTQTFASVLSEARKYKLSLVLAHQYLGQLENNVRNAILGNVGTMVFFNMSANDADFLKQEFNPLNPSVIQRLGVGEIVIKERMYLPYKAETFGEVFFEYDYTEKIVRQSKMKYGKSRAVVEDKIRRFIEK